MVRNGVLNGVVSVGMDVGVYHSMYDGVDGVSLGGGMNVCVCDVVHCV